MAGTVQLLILIIFLRFMFFGMLFIYEMSRRTFADFQLLQHNVVCCVLRCVYKGFQHLRGFFCRVSWLSPFLSPPTLLHSLKKTERNYRGSASEVMKGPSVLFVDFSPFGRKGKKLWKALKIYHRREKLKITPEY